VFDLQRERHRPFPTERRDFPPEPVSADAASDEAASEGAPPVSPGILGLNRPSQTLPPDEDPIPAAGRTLLGLDRRGSESPPADVEDKPIFETLERKPLRPIPVERSVLFSIALHILVVVLILLAPARKISSDGGGLIPAFVTPADDSPIPVAFKEAPGKERPNPKRSDLSDKDRVASGGDRAKPKAATPFAPEAPGRQALAPGAPLVSPPRGSLGAAEEAARPAAAAAAAREQQAQKSEAGSEPYVVPPNGPEHPAGERLANLQGAIRQAARGVSQPPGEGGAGFPNPDGGFVDNGPLSFDTSWYDWGPYAAEMVRRIKLHWDIPELARLGWKGRVTIRFYIRGDGRVEGANILSVSGVPPFDHAALQAILTSSPFRPLPKDLGSDREGVTVTFFYNLRPEDSKGSDGGGR
jgi:TonB family protein